MKCVFHYMTGMNKKNGLEGKYYLIHVQLLTKFLARYIVWIECVFIPFCDNKISHGYRHVFIAELENLFSVNCVNPSETAIIPHVKET